MPDDRRTQLENSYCPYGNSYKHCKCDVCRAKIALNMRNFRRRQTERSYGVEHDQDLVPATATYEALADAHNTHGISFREISDVTGLRSSTITKIWGKNGEGRVRKTTEKVILDSYGPDRGTPARHLEGRRVTDRKQYEWKIQCLLAQGWTKAHLDEMVRANRGPSSVISHMSYRHPDFITANTAKNLEWLIEFVGDRTGPSETNKRRMRARGIYPLIHYTEDGQLIRKSVPGLVKPREKRVKSTHGAASSSGDRSAA